MTNEKDLLRQQIKELEEKIKPLQDKLNSLYITDASVIKERIRQCNQMTGGYFTLEELMFAARNRCHCGAGMAYPEGIGFYGSWYCSDILLGQALPASSHDSKVHIKEFPFSFYEILSENQPSANGETTRPTKTL